MNNLSMKGICRRSLLYLVMLSMIVGFLAAFAPKVQAAEPRVDNPFVGATAYINPDYAALIDTSIAQTSDSDLVARMETVKSYPTAVWLDRIAAIHGGARMPGGKAWRIILIWRWRRSKAVCRLRRQSLFMICLAGTARRLHQRRASLVARRSPAVQDRIYRCHYRSARQAEIPGHSHCHGH